MKQLLASFTQYEFWANEQLLNIILSLSVEQQQQLIISSFPSIYKTCLHIWDASSIWWQRLQKTEQIMVPSISSHPSLKDIVQGILQQNQEWINWIDTAEVSDLENALSYKSLKGDAYAQPVHEIILHLNNHGTYHRGQLVTMLRQVGVANIPQTDYILFRRL